MAGPAPPAICRPGTWICTGCIMPEFLEPTLARCTISFWSPSCMPFNPWIACSVSDESTYSQSVNLAQARRRVLDQVEGTQLAEGHEQLLDLVLGQVAGQAAHRSCWAKSGATVETTPTTPGC